MASESVSKFINIGSIAAYAASVASSMGSSIEGSSFSGLFTRVEINQIRMRSAGNCPIRPRGLLAKPAGVITRGQYDRHTVVDLGDQGAARISAKRINQFQAIDQELCYLLSLTSVPMQRENPERLGEGIRNARTVR